MDFFYMLNISKLTRATIVAMLTGLVGCGNAANCPPSVVVHSVEQGHTVQIPVNVTNVNHCTVKRDYNLVRCLVDITDNVTDVKSVYLEDTNIRDDMVIFLTCEEIDTNTTVFVCNGIASSSIDNDYRIYNHESTSQIPME